MRGGGFARETIHRECTIAAVLKRVNCNVGSVDSQRERQRGSDWQTVMTTGQFYASYVVHTHIYTDAHA